MEQKLQVKGEDQKNVENKTLKRNGAYLPNKQ